jgi:ElaB/YqjD/DUF883 family membrane-anchored ribosome-binding protein
VTNGTEQKTPEEIRAEIESTREDLGDTAAALASKADVKARTKEKVEAVKQIVAQKTEALKSGNGDGGSAASSPVTQVKAKAQENPIPTAAIAAFVGGFVLGRLSARS